METEINVAATLKDKPQGVKLYSRICGAVELKEVLDVRKKKSIVVKELNSSNQHRFWYDGKFFRAGQCVLQPSKEMADWSKFAWKKGDVLVCKDVNSHIIFEAFNDDTYTTFTGKQNYQATRVGYSYAHTRNIAMTQDFDIEKGDAAQTYINTIEEKLGGKLNRETLEVEKQPEFKDGDILSIQEDEEHYHAILIFKGGTDVYVYFVYFHRVLTYGTKIDENEKSISHLATDEEKQQFFSALKKENKAWDADKKMLVDLKPKVEFKPFDKVLVRDNEDDIWEVSLFGYKDELYYRCDNGIPWIQCIPYDGNEHLLGTTNNVEG